MQAIQIRHLHKTYANGTQALRDVSLDIARGDFFALLGANGAGKTTLIGILTGLVNKTAGQVRVFDMDQDRCFARIKRSIGVVPQELNFSIFERTQDILLTQAGYFGIARAEARVRSEQILRQLGLWDKRREVSRALSGGMKRRLMIARALIHHPQLLILDEPTAGVDVELRHGMWDYLREINRQGVTILLTTHYLEEAEQMCRHAAIIKQGEVIRSDSVRNLVQALDEETYVITVQGRPALAGLRAYQPVAVDAHAFKVALKKERLHDLLTDTGRAGMRIVDIHPQGHRLERLFLQLLRD